MASKSKLCDSCKSAVATLLCRADSAFLCVNCDTKIHAANKLASRHARVWLCEVCEQAPAHVTCKADDATLCVTCDRDIHSANPLSRRHERVPVAPFYDDTASEVSRSEEAEAASWLLPNLNSSSSCYVLSSAADDDHIMDPYLDPDYYVDPKTEQQDDDDDPEEQTADDGVVPVPAAELLAHKPPFFFGHCSLISHSVSSSSSSLDVDVGVVPDSTADVSDPYHLKTSVVQISSADRQARVLRYREKRKNRKFEKTIRYASRKAYAETRPRIKGRFAKRTTQVEIQGRYGVVPSSF